MHIGTHVSAAGSVFSAIKKAKELGINTIQIFASPPSNWNPSKITDSEAAQFGKQCKEEGIEYIFLHAIYLINLGSDNPELIEKSKKSLINYLNISAAMKANGVIFHVGSTKGRQFSEVKKDVVDHINYILENSDLNSTLILETNAGQGNNIGDTFEELAEIITEIKNKSRVGVCLDTAHVFASGYDIANKSQEIFDQFDKIIGLEKLKAIHANDSKTEFNSRKDRHENIGAGKIGETAFQKIIHIPELKEIPFIIETPGFDNKGPDKQNVDILKKLAGE